jgi:glyoxalase family protein
MRVRDARGGMAAAYAYAVPEGGFDGWMLRLAEDAVDFLGPKERFGQRVILLRDPDGAPVELIETDRESDEALDGFHSVTLWERDLAPTARLLMTDVFGYEDAGTRPWTGWSGCDWRHPAMRGAQSST